MKNIIWNKKKNFIIDFKNLKKDLELRAKNSEDKRSRICIHSSTSDRVQEMIIFAFKNSFMPPHKHSNYKSESYHIIEGKMDLYIFDDRGKIVDKLILKKNNNKKDSIFYYRSNNPNFWHMPVVKSKYCIFHEIFSGPFVKKKNIIFPKWIEKIKTNHKKF